MKAAFLIVNSACYNHCRYCFYNADIYARETANFDVNNIPYLITFLINNSISELMLTGGDCLHKSYVSDTIQIITQVKQQTGTKVHILSSSSSLTLETALRLKEAGLDSVYISLDSVDLAANDFLRGRTQKTLEAIPLYKQVGIDIRATMVVSSYSSLTLKQTYAFLVSSGFSEINIQPCHLPDSFKDIYNLKIESLSSSKFISLFNDISTFLIEQNKKNYADLLQKLYIRHESISPIVCFMGRDKCVITNTGDVMLCFHRLEKLGTIFDAEKLPLMTNTCTVAGKHCVSLFSEKYYCG